MEKVNELLSQYKIPIAILLLGLVIIFGNLFFDNKPEQKVYPNSSIVDPNTIKSIKVDISGAVNTPGVYSLKEENRIEDVIKAAGGFASEVNKEYVAKNINLAQKLSDGIKIYIPFEDEQISTILGSNKSTLSATGKISLNSASIQELDTLPGVGTVTATKIINARPFTNVSDLINKKIVSKSVFAKIKDSVVVN